MRTIQNTLYVMTQNAYLHLENDTLRVEVEREKKLQVPLHHLGSVVCLGNILLRQAQHRLALDEKFALGIAHCTIAGKLRNGRQVLLRGAREAGDEEECSTLTAAAETLSNSLRNLPHAPDLDVVRGIEGDAAKNYFAALPLLVKREARNKFTMDGRTRRPPRDRFNALLSFLYSMLMNDCRSALEAVGLDPQLGFLQP